MMEEDKLTSFKEMQISEGKNKNTVNNKFKAARAVLRANDKPLTAEILASIDPDKAIRVYKAVAGDKENNSPNTISTNINKFLQLVREYRTAQSAPLFTEDKTINNSLQSQQAKKRFSLIFQCNGMTYDSKKSDADAEEAVRAIISALLRILDDESSLKASLKGLI